MPKETQKISLIEDKMDQKEPKIDLKRKSVEDLTSPKPTKQRKIFQETKSQHSPIEISLSQNNTTLIDLTTLPNEIQLSPPTQSSPTLMNQHLFGTQSQSTRSQSQSISQRSFIMSQSQSQSNIVDLSQQESQSSPIVPFAFSQSSQGPLDVMFYSPSNSQVEHSQPISIRSGPSQGRPPSHGDWLIIQAFHEDALSKFVKIQHRSNGETKIVHVSHHHGGTNTQQPLAEDWFVTILSTFNTTRYAYMFCENQEFVSLKQQLKILQRFDLEVVIFFSAQLLLAFEQLHRHKLKYRAFSSSKILIDSSGYIKLIQPLKWEKQHIDFQYYAYYLPPEFIAPERNEATDDFSSDWWKFGILIYEMLTGETPFYAQTKNQVVDNILKGKVNWDILSELNSTKDLLMTLLCEAKLRLSFEQIKEHPFFKGVNWEGLNQRTVLSLFQPKMDDHLVESLSNADDASEEDWMGLEFS